MASPPRGRATGPVLEIAGKNARRARTLFVAAALTLSSAATTQADDAPLREPPLSLDMLYTAEAAAVASGGAARGARYLDNLDVIVRADLAPLVGWQGARAHAYVLYNNGTPLRPLVGDTFATSNIETGVRALRLYEAWIEQRIGSRVSVKAGLYDLNSEFDALPTADLFLSSAHGIGTDIGQSGRNGPSIFPVTSLGVRLDWRPDTRTVLRLAVLDGVPGDPADPASTAVLFRPGEGVLVVGEADRRFGPVRVLAGAWHYSGTLDRFDGSTGQSTGGYLRGEAQLTRERDDVLQGLAGFVRFGIADGRVNRFARFASAGLVYQGLLPGRDGDRLGLAVAVGFASRGFRATTGAADHETGLELTYRTQLAPWLTVQPDVQYVFSPSGNPGVGDALVLGMRVEVGFSLGR